VRPLARVRLHGGDEVRLGAAEVDRSGAPRGGGAVLRTEEYGREQLAQWWFGRAHVRASGREARPGRHDGRQVKDRYGEPEGGE
jgi:hypothetical protein